MDVVSGGNLTRAGRVDGSLRLRFISFSFRFRSFVFRFILEEVANADACTQLPGMKSHISDWLSIKQRSFCASTGKQKREGRRGLYAKKKGVKGVPATGKEFIYSYRLTCCCC